MNKKILITIIAVMMAVLMSAASCLVVSAVEEPTNDETVDVIDVPKPTVYGDVNDDEAVNINDVTEYQLVLVGAKDATEAFERNGDANVDGKKNIWDVTTIQYFIAGNFKKLPVTTDGYYGEIIRP